MSFQGFKIMPKVVYKIKRSVPSRSYQYQQSTSSDTHHINGSIQLRKIPPVNCQICKIHWHSNLPNLRLYEVQLLWQLVDLMCDYTLNQQMVIGCKKKTLKLFFPPQIQIQKFPYYLMLGFWQLAYKGCLYVKNKVRGRWTAQLCCY